MQIADNIEHWALIDGYSNYEISSFGRVRNNQTNRILKGYLNKGYHSILLSNNCETKNFQIHRLVAFAFCDKRDEYNIVDHIDRNPKNNNFTNLRWVNSELNSKNTKTGTNNTSGIKGIFYHKEKDRWVARWFVEKKPKTKFFKDKDDAIAYRQEMEQLHGYL